VEIDIGEEVKFQNEIYTVLGSVYNFKSENYFVRLRKNSDRSVEIRIPEKQFEEEAVEVNHLFEALDKILKD